MRDPYEVLNVKRNAKREEIKKAFREKAMQHHPDKGGDTKKFSDVNQAYTILINDESREYYDRTGTEKQSNLSQRAMSVIMQIFDGIITSNRIEVLRRCDLVIEIRIKIDAAQQTLNKQVNECNREINKLKDVASRISIEGDENVLAQICEAKISNAETRITKLKEEIIIGEESLRLLDKCKYKYDVEEQSEGNLQILMNQFRMSMEGTA